MNFDYNYLKEYNTHIKPNKKIGLLSNISTDFSKTIKLTNNNYFHQINSHTNANNHNHNHYLYDKKVFKNTKLYNVIKPTKYIKKRNNSNSAIHNNFVESSLTEGNLHGNNTKKFISIFNSSNLKINHRNIKLQKNPNNTNNNIKMKKLTNTNINALLHNSNSFKLLTKSKSNVGFINFPNYQNLVINNSRDKNSMNHNNKKMFSTIGLSNNLSVKNIKNYSRINRNNKQNINLNTNNNKLSDSTPKRSVDILEKIKGLKKEIENYKKEINKKNQIIKNLEIKINKINKDNENNQKMLKNITQKYNNLQKEYDIMKNNFFLLKNKIAESEKKIKLMEQKELKLMQVLYLIKEKGIDINSILNEVNKVSSHENISSQSPLDIKNLKDEKEYNDNKDKLDNIDNIDSNLIINSIRDNISNESERSDMTVYFPDKLKMNNIMETKWGKNIPKLNFGYVPEYSDLDSGKQEQKNNNLNYMQMNEDNNILLPKFNKFQNSA